MSYKWCIKICDTGITSCWLSLSSCRVCHPGVTVWLLSVMTAAPRLHLELQQQCCLGCLMKLLCYTFRMRSIFSVISPLVLSCHVLEKLFPRSSDPWSTASLYDFLFFFNWWICLVGHISLQNQKKKIIRKEEILFILKKIKLLNTVTLFTW